MQAQTQLTVSGMLGALFASSLLVFVGAAKEEHFIGWLGETYDRSNSQQAPEHGMEILSWEPRIFLYRGFLTPDEADHIINWAEPRLVRSYVSNAATGAGETSIVRTSSGVFVLKGQDEVVKRIEERISKWTMLPVENGEDMNVLRYKLGQKYDSHHDYFSFKTQDENGGNRMCTVLMYLSDVAEGGETVFPHVPPLPRQLGPNSTFSECARKGLAVQPRKGDAIAFWSIKPSGSFDFKSLHGACPVVKGQKWSMTKWIHVGKFGSNQTVKRTIYEAPPPPIPEGCEDKHENCALWAETGECFVNKGFMVGTKEKPGYCLASCYRCDLMPEEDADE